MSDHLLRQLILDYLESLSTNDIKVTYCKVNDICDYVSTGFSDVSVLSYSEIESYVRMTLDQLRLDGLIFSSRTAFLKFEDKWSLDSDYPFQVSVYPK